MNKFTVWYDEFAYFGKEWFDNNKKILYWLLFLALVPNIFVLFCNGDKEILKFVFCSSDISTHNCSSLVWAKNKEYWYRFIIFPVFSLVCSILLLIFKKNNLRIVDYFFIFLCIILSAIIPIIFGLVIIMVAVGDL